MPRTARAAVAGYCYHVLNRANEKARVFHDHQDYRHFLALMADAQQRWAMDVFALCLMSNHVHLVVRPRADDHLARWMHWLFTCHVGYQRRRYETNGHVWQGRFKSFVIQQDLHFLTVMRYVERNALSAGLVARAEDWLWGSLNWRVSGFPSLALCSPPVALPADWQRHVNEALTEKELKAIETSISRGRPFGTPSWVRKTAAALGLTSSIAPRGRPLKDPGERQRMLLLED
jgi:putative transposase